MTGKDKDYRYMATSDLLNELSKDSFKPDADLDHKIFNIVLQQLDDASGDVSGLAVKWLATCSILGYKRARFDDICDYILSRLCNSTVEERQRLCAAVGAMAQELKDQGIPSTHTAYLGTTISSLDE
ncbi:hypothetical protein Syun_007479 [Stephania yunnanensis]|uniref:RRP12 N-terminal HEAT domain-containing protein n=1 Tax=Stephania yunnanensis TaxID=152371 RepID=A0AAP0PYR6_9MAGN